VRFLIFLMWLLHWLPLPVLGRLGEGIGSLLYIGMKERRHIALTNLRLCLPHLPEAERKQIARKHFQDYARSILERGILWWAPRERVKSLIEIEPDIPFADIQSGPVIFLCPHFVCLEVPAVAITMETPGCSIYTRQKNRVFDAVLYRGRMRFNSAIRLLSRQQGIKPIIRALREGLPFFMLPDMDFGAQDAEFVPFFGQPVATLTAPARIAAATGAKVIPVIATFLPDYRGWKVKFYPSWDNFPGPDITEATRRMNAFIEERVLETPAEYFWTHKRFKTRPAGEPDVYEQKN